MSYDCKSELQSNNVRSSTLDSEGNIWAVTDLGVSKFDGKSWSNYPCENLEGCNLNYYITIDYKGNKWLGGAGLTKFDGTKWTNYTQGQNVPGSGVTTVTHDKQGNLWFGTIAGLSKFDDTTFVTFSEIIPPFITGLRSVIIDKHENKWFGVEDGVLKFDDKIWTSYIRFEKNVNSYNTYGVNTFDNLGNIWISSNIGITKFDGKKWIDYSVGATSLIQAGGIVIDSYGNKWGGMDGGIFKFNDTTWTKFSVDYSSSYNFGTDLVVDKESNIWFLKYQRGLAKFDGKGVTNYFNSNVRQALAIDAQGNKWMGTGGGLSKFDGSNWVTYSLGSGYLNVNSIEIDALDNKWLATNGGLIKFDDVLLEKYTSGFSLVVVSGSNGEKWITHGTNFLDVINGVGKLDLNKVQVGLVFIDINSNGRKDFNETSIVKQIIKIDNYNTATKNTGLFYTSLNNGSHTFTLRPQANWKLTTDSSITVIVTDAPIKDTIYFGVQALANIHEVQTKLSGTATRANFDSKSWINYTNIGTLSENGTVSYNIANGATLVQSFPLADSVLGNRLVWKFSNLIPNEQRQISIVTKMPGVQYLGDTLVSISKIKTAFAEYSDTLKQVLTGSYDPNDKLVKQGIGEKGYVSLGKELEYTIRFQNTGTDTAFNVNVRDTLDMNLDVASLQIVAYSHPVKLDLRGQNEATFRFENIKLPHQKNNDLGSNGFVKYTIRPKKNLPEYTMVKNKAYIYFDFNPAIITNETVNTYVRILPADPTGITDYKLYKAATVYTNPAKDDFTIVFPNTEEYEVSLANIQGKVVREWNNIKGAEARLALDNLIQGMYLYTAQGSNGQKFVGKLVVGR